MTKPTKIMDNNSKTCKIMRNCYKNGVKNLLNFVVNFHVHLHATVTGPDEFVNLQGHEYL